MFQVKALMIENEALAPGYYRMRLLAPEIASAAQPGQFVQIKVAEASAVDPLLPRPISIYRIDAAGGAIEVIYKSVGRGTAMLAGKPAGGVLEVFGPIGKGFTVPETVQHLALIGGGVGMPPLYSLAQRLKKQRPDLAITLFYGGRSQTDILELERWNALGVKTWIATEDGSLGTKGFVTAGFIEQLGVQKFDYLAACGPKPMLKAVRGIALEHNLSGEISLEAHMACGVGACLGCTCKTEHGYRRVCVDGPVFPLGEVNLDD